MLDKPGLALRALNSAEMLVSDVNNEHQIDNEHEIIVLRTLVDATVPQAKGFVNLPADIVIAVGRAGLSSDPEFVVRMAGVCSAWRLVVQTAPVLWSRLKLGPSQSVLKLGNWLAKSQGNIVSLHLVDFKSFSAAQKKTVGTSLSDTIKGLRSLETDFVPVAWHHKFCNLQHLAGKGLRLETLFHPSSRSLKKLEASINIDTAETRLWAPFVSDLELFDGSCVGDTAKFLQQTPKLNWLRLSKGTIEHAVTLPALRHLELERKDLLELINAPNLHHLSAEYTDFIKAPRLRITKAQLVSLTLTTVQSTAPSILEQLRPLEALIHLNLDFYDNKRPCKRSTGDGLLEGLMVKDGTGTFILPKLLTLSLGGIEVSDDLLLAMVTIRTQSSESVAKLVWVEYFHYDYVKNDRVKPPLKSTTVTALKLLLPYFGHDITDIPNPEDAVSILAERAAAKASAVAGEGGEQMAGESKRKGGEDNLEPGADAKRAKV